MPSDGISPTGVFACSVSAVLVASVVSSSAVVSSTADYSGWANPDRFEDSEEHVLLWFPRAARGALRYGRRGDRRGDRSVDRQ